MQEGLIFPAQMPSELNLSLIACLSISFYLRYINLATYTFWIFFIRQGLFTNKTTNIAPVIRLPKKSSPPSSTKTKPSLTSLLPSSFSPGHHQLPNYSQFADITSPPPGQMSHDIEPGLFSQFVDIALFFFFSPAIIK